MSGGSNQRGPSIVGPFILIGLGIILLTQQLNMIHWSLWEVALRLWPLIIIAVGADILVARRSFLAAAATLVVVLALLAGGLYLMGAGPSVTGEKLASETVSYPLEDAETGKIELSMDAGTMKVDAMTEDSGNVIEGTVHQAPGQEVRSSRSMAGQEVVVSIRTAWPRSYIFQTDIDYLWDLALTRTISLDVDLSLGAGEINADLSGLKVTAVNVRVGAGKLVLTLPPEQAVDVEVSVGAGAAEIHLPEGAAVSIQCSTGFGDCELPGGSGFWSQTYKSPDYESSDYRIDIQVNVGVGGVRVVR